MACRRFPLLRVVCLVAHCICMYRAIDGGDDFVLDKDAATRGFVSPTHLDLKCGDNPTAFFVRAGDSFLGHDSSFFDVSRASSHTLGGGMVDIFMYQC